MIAKLLLLFSIILTSGLLITPTTENVLSAQSKYPKTSSYIHSSVFFDKKSFFEGVAKAETSKRLNYQIKGGVIPHHILPSFILSDFFQKLSNQNLRTIILIGPNHFEKGEYKLLSSNGSWDTPFGQVNVNKNLLNLIEKQSSLKMDDQVLSAEHSIGTMMPYIKYYLPNTNVVPIILSGYLNKKDLDSFSSILQKIVDKDTCVIASVDFSHYLYRIKARENDRLTKKLMENFEFDNLLRLNNDYIDSPPSIVMMLMLMQKQNTANFDIYFNTNSGDLLNDDSIETTSYFSIGFH